MSSNPDGSIESLVWSVVEKSATIAVEKLANAAFDSFKPNKSNFSSSVSSSSNSSAWREQGLTLYQLGNYSGAITAFDQALLLDSKDGLVWYMRGVALRLLGHHEAALNSFDESIKIKPNGYAYGLKGIILFEFKKYAEALESYDKALQHRLDDPIVWSLRGDVLLQFRNSVEAATSYRKSLLYDPNNVQTWKKLGYTSINFFPIDAQVAINAFDNALRFDPNDSSVWLAKARSFSWLTQYSQALDCCNRSLLINSTDPEAWYQKGRMLQYLKDYGEAINCYKEALKHNYPDKEGLAQRMSSARWENPTYLRGVAILVIISVLALLVLVSKKVIGL